MKAFSSVDLYFLTKELKKLETGRVESFYFEDMVFYMRIYNKSQGHQYITFKLGNYIYLSKEKHETSHPNPFVSYLRKYLKNAFLESIEVIEGERILKLVLSKKKITENTQEDKEEFIKYHMYLEIFSPGNVILTTEEDIIINTLTKKNYKDRIVKNKEAYLLPPARELSLLTLDTLEDEIKISDLSVVKFFAMKFGMGSKYAEELVKRMKINKDTLVKEVDIQSIRKIIKEFISEELSPCVKKENNEIKDFYPLTFHEENLEKVESFNQGVSNYYSQFAVVEDKKEKGLDKEFKKLENRQKKQEAQKTQMLKDYDKYSEYGNKIYEHFTLLEEVILSINKAAKEKGWESVLETIKTNEKLSFIKKLDYKNNKIIVELK
jgi:predicted ribosome quality control (RQC) complex YloA/Tae2 family protein